MIVTFVGAGAMGGSLLRGLLASGAPAESVLVVEPQQQRARELEQTHGIAVVGLGEGVRRAELVVVAVKPHDVAATLREASGYLRPGTVVVSVAAGLTTGTLEQHLPEGTPVVRAMPNTPAQVGAGVTAVSLGRHASEQHGAAAGDVLAAVGRVVRVPEAQMDAVTAVSGSGPAYVFLVAEAMIEAGVHAGLPRDLATDLVVGTLVGSAAMLDQTGEHPAILRERVTSPGGTTAAALARLEQHGLRAAFVEAVLANRDRARELGG
jgi:pyrroline-5-carboxylate reductase